MTAQYQHYRYDEHCPDNPAAILEHVEAMMQGLAKLPKGRWYIRVRPEIHRGIKLFDSQEILATVRCRVSVELGTATDQYDDARLFGFS